MKLHQLSRFFLFTSWALSVNANPNINVPKQDDIRDLDEQLISRSEVVPVLFGRHSESIERRADEAAQARTLTERYAIHKSEPTDNAD